MSFQVKMKDNSDEEDLEEIDESYFEELPPPLKILPQDLIPVAAKMSPDKSNKFINYALALKTKPQKKKHKKYVQSAEELLSKWAFLVPKEKQKKDRHRKKVKHSL